MSVIVALLPDPTHLARLRGAARGTHTLIACASWTDLMTTCSSQLVHVAVLDLDVAANPTFDAVRQLKRLNPTVVLVAYAALSPDRVRHIFDAGRYGFEALVVADLDDGPSAFARALEKATARGVASRVRTELPQARDPLVRDALLASITRAHERLTPGALATILGSSPRGLSRALAAAGYPSAHRLIMWGRLIVAAELMDATTHSADRIALALSFPSGSAFRNNCHRYVKAKPTEIRALGGAAHVFRLLREEIGNRSAAGATSASVAAT